MKPYILSISLLLCLSQVPLHVHKGKATHHADAPGRHSITQVHFGRLIFTPPPLPPLFSSAIITATRQAVITGCSSSFSFRSRSSVAIMVR
ncbi:hypothetical protein F5B22DRAFT_150914 [Xylaria bambusicola]|uniref:uncharacterized protein n=1 Tax=Xylaria bambusicola TaxID=326684 RepID=UPI0020080772|nr:uncharacterized protein F5B22DRAFT_150914 [Xylaria bambusicola]KAI0526288.1 hypothetical protein F5B22DRAFT_150914 [Xylaria bambusicola]